MWMSFANKCKDIHNSLDNSRVLEDAMPFVPVPEAVQVEMIYSLNGQTVENVLHFRTADSINTASMTALATNLGLWWSSDLRPFFATTVSLLRIRVTDITNVTGPVVEYGGGLPLVGTGIGTQMPNNVALVITKRTDQRGRSYRGRIYHFGWTEEQNTINVVSPTIVNAVLAAYNELKAFPSGTHTWNLSVVSRYQNGNWLVEGIATPVTQLTTDGSIDSQRRRLPGRGS